MSEETTVDNTKGETEASKPQEVKLADLKIELMELGFKKEDADAFKTKDAASATIRMMKTRNALENEPVNEFDPVETPKEKKTDGKNWKNKAEQMGAILADQPTIRIKLPLDIGGKEKPGVVREMMIKGKMEKVVVSGAYETVTINGYRTVIPKGVPWHVPQQVSDILDEADRATSAAGEEFLTDRIDPETGKKIAESF